MKGRLTLAAVLILICGIFAVFGEETALTIDDDIIDPNEPCFMLTTGTTSSYAETVSIEMDGGSVELSINDRGELDIEYEGDINEPAMFFFDYYLKGMCEQWMKANGYVAAEKEFKGCNHSHLVSSQDHWNMSFSGTLMGKRYKCRECGAEITVSIAYVTKPKEKD